VSGDSLSPTVRLAGPQMKGIVEAIPLVRDMTGQVPTVIGGLAVMCRLARPHRVTTDLDTVRPVSPGQPSHLEVLLSTPGAQAADATGVLLSTASGQIKVDVLEISEAEIASPSENENDRLFVLSHAWAYDTATDVRIEVESGGEVVVSESARVAQPGPLVAMKLQALINRPTVKEATDLLDIIRLFLDPITTEAVVDQLRTCDSRIAGDVSMHAEQPFQSDIARSLRLVRSAGGHDLEADDLRLVGELTMGATRRAEE